MRENCHWLSSEPFFSFSIQWPPSLGSHVWRKHGHLLARLFLQLLLPLKRGEIFIETNCLSLQGAEPSECQPMKIHWVVIVIRCEGSGEGSLTSLLFVELSYCPGQTLMASGESSGKASFSRRGQAVASDVHPKGQHERIGLKIKLTKYISFRFVWRISLSASGSATPVGTMLFNQARGEHL